MKSSIICVLAISFAVVQTLVAQASTPRPAPAPLYQFWMGGVGTGSFLGVDATEIDSNRARTLNLKEEYGVEITRVDDGSPAEKAGLKGGDVVLEYNGQRVEGIEQFQRLVRETPAGRNVKLLISRNGSAQTLTATVGTRKSKVYQGGVKELMGDSFDIPFPEMPNVFSMSRTSILGVEAESLGSQLAEYFGVKEGVLVRAVLKGSAAEKAGIKAGDVITKVDQTKVTGPGEVSSAIRSARSKRTFPVELTREHREMTVTVTIEEDRSDRGMIAPRARVIRGNVL